MPSQSPQVLPFPKRITYLCPGSLRRGSSPDTGPCCLAKVRNQAPQDVCAGFLEHAHELCHGAKKLTHFRYARKASGLRVSQSYAVQPQCIQDHRHRTKTHRCRCDNRGKQ